MPHRGVVRLVKQSVYVDFGPDEVFLQLAPVTFDASTLEIWGALLNGGRLVLTPPGAPSLDDVAGVLTGEGVTVLWLTAGLFHLMVEQELEALASVRQVVAGGDVLSAGACAAVAAGQRRKWGCSQRLWSNRNDYLCLLPSHERRERVGAWECQSADRSATRRCMC